jgi:dihydrofolate synthase/folylpolyglutamate synthase
MVVGTERGPALDVLRDSARESGAIFVAAREVAGLQETSDGTFTVTTARGRYDRLRIPLAGAHQKENARVAVVALESFANALGLEPSPEAVRHGLERTRWRGRLEWIDGNPPMLLDAAHNPAGLKSLLAHLEDGQRSPPVLLFAAMRDKDLEAMLRPLAARASAVVVTRPRVRRAAPIQDLLEASRSWCHRSEAVADPALAVERARELAGSEGWVLVAGSLYLVGEVLTALEGEGAPGPVAM